MRRRAWVAMAALAAFAGWSMVPAPALAQPTATPEAEASPEAVPGEEVCTITDPRLVELSGIVATDEGYIVVNDSQDFIDRKPIFLLDQSCNVVDQIDFPTLPLDPEDLALDRENDILWVGDTGDNVAGGFAAGGSTRPTVALWRVDLAGDRTPVIHRFVYPDGQARDAEAIVLDGDGTPIIITKDVSTTELYRPTEFVPNNPPEQGVPLELVGEFTPPETDSSHPFLPPAAASRVITGGANSPDGSRVVLRTYTDALEFDVTDGDVVAAITEGEPRVTPLPGEPMGEAISYTPDGERFVTVSDSPPAEVDLGEGFVPVILAYTPTAPAPPSPTGEPAPREGGSSGSSLFSLNPDTIMLAIGAVGLLGLVMVVIGVTGIVRARRRAAAGGGGDGEGDGGAIPTQSRGAASVGAAAVAASASVAASAAAVSSAAGASSAGTVYGSSARVPAPSPSADTEWAPSEAEQPGVYRSASSGGGGVYRSAQYGGEEAYGDDEAAYAADGAHYDDGAHYAADGGHYGGDGAHYDDGAHYGADGGGYDGGGYDAGYDEGGYHAGYAEPGDYAAYDPHAYGAQQEVDDYYDDPDYSYEFRRPGSDRY